MSKSSGHEIFISAAFFKTLATVFLDTPQLCAMFRSLNPKLCKRRISRYLVIIVTSFTCIHTNGVYQQYKGNICNRAFKCGSELPEYVALILRNGGSQSPDRWLRELRNNQPALHITVFTFMTRSVSIKRLKFFPGFIPALKCTFFETQTTIHTFVLINHRI